MNLDGKRQAASGVAVVRFRGRPLGEGRIAKIRALISAEPEMTRSELSRRLCRRWNWRRPNGEPAVPACSALLRRLDAMGRIKLPPPKTRPGRRKACSSSLAGQEGGCPPEVTRDRVAPKEVKVRLLGQEERERWQEWMARYHYLGDGRLVGECLRYVAEYEGEWLALSGWAAAAMKSRWREAYVGWDAETRWQRLYLVANHVRFLILPWVHVPNLASCVLARNLRRLSEDWWSIYGHPVLLAETFVDLSRFRGSCYRAANWTYLGETQGYGKSGPTYRAHGQAKGLFVYPLDPHARDILSSPFPPCFASRPEEHAMNIDVSRLPIEGRDGLLDVLSEIPDPRMLRGVRHPFRAVLGVAACAVLTGAKGFLAISEYAGDLSWETLRRFGFRRKDWGAPSEPTFRRVLQSTDANRLDEKVGEWARRQTSLQGKGIAMDGKTLRGSGDGNQKPVHLFSAVLHEEGIVLGQKPVDVKTNEITVVKPLLEEMDLEGAVVTADALHTQKEAARFLVEEKKADYIFIAKDNQPTLRKEIESLNWGAFSPSAEQDHGRQNPRPD